MWKERKGFGWVWLGLCKERKGFGWGMGPLANKVWIQPRFLAGSTPQPCGHEDLSFATTGGWGVRCGSAGQHSQNSRQGAAVERACTATCMKDKFGCSESARCAYRLA